MTRLRRLRYAIELHARTDWPVWAVLAVSALLGVCIGRHHGVAIGILVGVLACMALARALLLADASGRREERDRRRR